MRHFARLFVWAGPVWVFGPPVVSLLAVQGRGDSLVGWTITISLIYLAVTGVLLGIAVNDVVDRV